MTRYCCRCLDLWVVRWDRAEWLNVPPGTHLHVTCGRALEAIRTAPVVYEELRDA